MNVRGSIVLFCLILLSFPLLAAGGQPRGFPLCKNQDGLAEYEAVRQRYFGLLHRAGTFFGLEAAAVAKDFEKHVVLARTTRRGLCLFKERSDPRATILLVYRRGENLEYMEYFSSTPSFHLGIKEDDWLDSNNPAEGIHGLIIGWRRMHIAKGDGTAEEQGAFERFCRNLHEKLGAVGGSPLLCSSETWNKH